MEMVFQHAKGDSRIVKERRFFEKILCGGESYKKLVTSAEKRESSSTIRQIRQLPGESKKVHIHLVFPLIAISIL